MHLRSFFVRTAFLQVVGIFFLWGVLIFWLTFYYLPDSGEKSLDQQLQSISQGIGDMSEDIDEGKGNYVKFVYDFENMFIKAIDTGLNNGFNYRPLIAVFDKQNQLIYTSPDTMSDVIRTLPNNKMSGVLDYAGDRWHIFGSMSKNQNYRVIVGETHSDRAVRLGSPVGLTAIPLAIILGTIVLTILFTAYYSLRPLSMTAKMIASRQPGNFTAIEVKDQYQEIRPIIIEINQLMARIEAADMREKRFMADAAHELRTPIAAALAQLHLLAQLQNWEERQEVIEDMQRGLDRAASLSRQLIDISRLESDSFTLKVGPVDVYDEIGKCIAFYAPYGLKKGINISLEGDKHVVIDTDGQSLNVTLSNLLDNAIKYGNHGGMIEVHLQSYAPIGCKITIRDDGPGVSAEHRVPCLSASSGCRG
ncbi:histidine kinase dimerization/phospho-acceptor domain-containing protein [Buttiauxella gaviniae]|uniref:histidine kinase dimerization/phospho-acceptor domain-containing protein n=1 Tax=Buttiauxella gaviniae TaxID=82990 RepID=UPI003C73AFF1